VRNLGDSANQQACAEDQSVRAALRPTRPQPETKGIYTSRIAAVADIFGRVGRSTLRATRGMAGIRKYLKLKIFTNPGHTSGRACPVLQHQLHRVLHSKHTQATSPPCGRAALAGRTVRLVHPPAPADGSVVAAKCLLQYRQQLDCPAVHGQMIDRSSALSHHLFQMTQAQRIGHVPAHAHQDHTPRVMQAFKHARYSWVHGLLHRSHRLFYRWQHNRPPYCDQSPSK